MIQNKSNSFVSLLVNLALLLVVYLLIEAGSFVLYRITLGEWYTAPSVQTFAQQASSKDSQSVEDLLRGKQSVLHPYVGYVYNPEGWTVKHDGIPISNFGYIDNKTPIHKRSDSSVIVGVFGGSVAWWFQQIGMPAVLEQLQHHPDFKDKELILVRLALGGYKQPQQLMTLNYLAALGAEFDYVINLDGYNEVALPAFHNTPHGINPHFPINWKEQLLAVGTSDSIRTLGRLTLLQERRDSIATGMTSSILRLSPSAAMLWRLYDKNMASQLNALRNKLSSPISADGNLPFALSGPPATAEGQKLFHELSQVWEQSSLAMHRFCQSNQCRYYHFLQPNQYVPQSKSMSSEEKKIALGGHETMTQGVEQGYPLLRSHGKALKAAGVKFYDTSMVFAETQEQTYNDSCCHLTKTGNEILGKRIGQIIAQDLRR